MKASFRIAHKLPMVIIGLCLAVSVAISVAAYLQSRKMLILQAEATFEVLMEERAAQLKRWAVGLENDVVGFGSNPNVQAAVAEFASAYRAVHDSPTEDYHRIYIHENPHEAGKRDALVQAGVDEPYHAQHAKFHPFFRKLKDSDGYYDMFLFNPEGDLIYSVFKENDFATNFLTGPFKESGLGVVFRAALKAGPGKAVSGDFAPYAPSAGAPAAFVATAVVDEAGKVIGVLAVQLPSMLTTDILANEAGLGTSGDIIAISGTGHARSNSRFNDGPHSLDQAVHEQRLAQFQNDPGTVLLNVEGMRGTQVMTSSINLPLLGFDWHVVAEMDVAEVIQPALRLRNVMTRLVAVGIAVSAVLGLLLARTMTGPLSRLGPVDAAGRGPRTRCRCAGYASQG